MSKNKLALLAFVIILPILFVILLLATSGTKPPADGTQGPQTAAPKDAPTIATPLSVPTVVVTPPTSSNPDPKPSDLNSTEAAELRSAADAARTEGRLEDLLTALRALSAISSTPELSAEMEKTVADLKQANETKEADRKALFKKHYEQGLLFAKAMDWDAAVAEFEAALKTAPEYESTISKNIKDCQMAKEKAKEFVKSLTESSSASYAAKNYGKTLDDIDKLLSIEPSNPKALELKRLIYKEHLLTDMVLIPAGDFTFGPPDAETKPTLPDFYIDLNEVTNEEYAIFVTASGAKPPASWQGPTLPDPLKNHPVTGVSCEDAKAYAKWAHKRLPTEEEWEKAARGMDGRVFPWGNEFSADKCNSAETKLMKTVPVGTFGSGAGSYGCLDMAGNASEWTSTVYGLRSDENNMSWFNFAIIKGGSFAFKRDGLRTYARNAEKTTVPLLDCGFRCALTAPILGK